MKTRRRVHLNNTRKGGKRLGKGVSAFVIDPPIQCKDGRDMTGYVTRVSRYPNFDEIMSKERKAIMNKLKKIDPDQKYFLYPQYCTPGELSEENKKDGVTEENKKYSEYLKKGKDDFSKYDYYYKTRNWKDFLKGRKKYIRVNAEEKLSEEQKEHLTKAVELLHKHKIVHADLHPGNIIEGEDGLPRIIDFARSLNDPPKLYYDDDIFILNRILGVNTPKTSFNPRR